MMEKFAEDDRIEQMNAQRRRMKMAEHRRETERLLEEKREMYNRLKLAEVEATRLKEQEEHRRASIIEEERRRLLQMYAKKYKDFLPKGVLLSDSDLALLAD